MTTFLRDVTLALRQLARRPGFAAAAITSLALGIGLNTTLFSVVNAVLLRGGAVERPDRLVEIYTGLTDDFPQLTTSYPDYLDIVEGADAMSGVAASAYVRGILSGTGRSALVVGEAVSANYFEVLGIRPVLGRGFRSDENLTRGAVPVAVLGHGLWQRQFGGRADIVGQTAKLSGVNYAIVGVGPREFTGTLPGVPTEFWVPVMMVEGFEFSGVQATSDNDPGTTRLDRRGQRWLFLKGRLADGRTVAEARAQVDAVFARLRTQYPITNEDTTASVLPAADIRFHPQLDGYVRAAGVVLLAAVGLVLLVACANVANLLLAQSEARAREFALRAALGASRGRLMRQMLSEGLVIATAGGALGVLIAWWSGRALAGLGTNVFPIPIAFEFTIDRTVLVFATLVSVATALVCSLAPAWSASKPSLVPALKNAVGQPRRRRVSLSDGLVVGQLALSLVLVVSGVLLGRGLLAARSADLGFDPGPVSALSFNLQMLGYDEPRARAFGDLAAEALKATAGVTAVSTATRLPLAPDINVDAILVPGHHAPESDGTSTDVVTVGADYFTAVGVPIVAGRAFTQDDIATGRRVAIVNQTMARLYWPDKPALGQQLHSGGFNSAPYEIVGVARDHRVRSIGEAPRPYLHLPGRPSRAIGFVVRTSAPAAVALPSLRQALWSLEPDILFTEDAPAEEVVQVTVAPTRLGALALGVFGGLALLLAAVGLYGVIAYSVSRRTREVGIRLALGAARGRVIRMVVYEGGRLAVAGVVLGLVASALVSGVFESMLYGVSGLDPFAFASAAGALLLVALLANLVPAFTASRVDPARSLRGD